MSNEEVMPTGEDEAAMGSAAAAGAERGAAPGEQPSHQEALVMLEDARARADDHWDQVLRLKAELENTRRRAQRDQESAHRYAIEKFVKELLPVCDSLEKAADASAASDADVATLREGTELTLQLLRQALERSGVSAVDPSGERFDPELHQAMTVQQRADVDPHTVLEVMQKGYTLNDRLVRPALVVVAKS